MINCIAVDDEPLALELIENYCSRLSFVDLKRTFTRTSDASRYLIAYPVDLLLLDIQMPDLSGLDFYKSINQPKMVIFTTAFSEYAVEGFNLNAVDYLLKPIKFDRFDQAMRKAKEYLDYLNNKDKEKGNYIVVRSDYSLVKLPIDEILLVEGFDNYVKIHTSSKKVIISHTSLKDILDHLPGNKFMRVHRSFIIPVSKNLALRNRQIIIGDREIPVGVSFIKEVEKLFRDLKTGSGNSQ